MGDFEGEVIFILLWTSKITCFRKLFHKKSKSMYIKEDCSDSFDDWLLQPQTTNHGAHTGNPGFQLQCRTPGQWAVHCHFDVWKHRHCGHRLVSYAHMTLTGDLCTRDIGWWVMHTWYWLVSYYAAHWLVSYGPMTLTGQVCTHDTNWWENSQDSCYSRKHFQGVQRGEGMVDVFGEQCLTADE